MYDEIDEDIILLADNDDISDIEQIFGSNDNWGDSTDFSIDEILDMPAEGKVQMNLTNMDSICSNGVSSNDLNLYRL